MPKKVNIVENDIEPPEETREEILQQIEEAPKEEIQPKKVEGKTRMRELYKCEHCNKYLTKKALNYSHTQYCKGLRPQQPDEETTCVEPPPPPPQPQLLERPMSVYELLRRERQQLKNERIQRLAQFIA